MNGETDSLYRRDVFCTGAYVEVGRPRHQEYPLITQLRNRPGVRKWFLDDRPLDEAENSQWLAEQVPGVNGALCAIRLLGTGVFLGTIGWSWIDPETGKGDFGRVAIVPETATQYRGVLPPNHFGFAHDAGIALLRFAFVELRLNEVQAVIMPGNVPSQLFAERCGLVLCGHEMHTRPDGSAELMMVLHITRETWTRRQQQAGEWTARASGE